MDIRKLIDKFMDGTSTLDEERLLGEYFSTEENLPQEFEPYREMFAYFDKGMPIDKRICVDRRSAMVVLLRRVVSVAAAVAVLFTVAYNMIGGGDNTPAVGNSSSRFTTQTVIKDSLPSPDVDSTASRNAHRETEPNIRPQRKFRYKPAPQDVFTADANTVVMTDSVDMAGMRMAEMELRKVELEQQYMLNIIKATNLLNVADIAATANEEVY